jgi:hypothetical protein
MITFVHILCYHFCYHFKGVIIYVFICCYYFSRSANVIIFMLSFSLVHILCYHLCYHLMLSFIVIISPLFLFPEIVTHSTKPSPADTGRTSGQNLLFLFSHFHSLSFSLVLFTETECPRELVQDGVLPSLAGGVWTGRCDLYCYRGTAARS